MSGLMQRMMSHYIALVTYILPAFVAKQSLSKFVLITNFLFLHLFRIVPLAKSEQLLKGGLPILFILG